MSPTPTPTTPPSRPDKAARLSLIHILQTRNLLYTAVTRARRIFVALGDEAALFQMTDNCREDRRFSALKYLLLGRISPQGPS